jgi:hypothetical protein
MCYFMSGGSNIQKILQELSTRTHQYLEGLSGIDYTNSSFVNSEPLNILAS